MTSNPYAETLIQKGYSKQEINQTRSSKRNFPCTIGMRTFQTEEEYQEALANFLNGY